MILNTYRRHTISNHPVLAPCLPSTLKYTKVAPTSCAARQASRPAATRHAGLALKHSAQHVAPATASAAAEAAAPQQSSHRGLYPACSAHAHGYLKVSDLHTVYYEEHGNPKGIPAIVVHGGPGAGCFPNHARFFDPQHYRIILLDQRGCGRSTPTGCLASNTTSDLVADLELLRQNLGVQQWLMLGGSWGVALSIAYAQAHPDAVLGLILRGVCLMRPFEIQWMYGGGAAALKPLAWAQFVGHLTPRERGNPVLGYYKRMLSSDANVRQAAAKAWMSWEMSVGFSNNQQLLVWDGQQWDAQPVPAAQQQQLQQRAVLPPPPRPARAAAAAALSAAAGAAELPALHRGGCVPAEVLAGSPSSSNNAGTIGSSSSSTDRSNCITAADFLGPSGPAPAETAHLNCASTPINNSSTRIVPNNTRTPQSATPTTPATPQQQQPAWVWGLPGPGQGFNLQDPEVQQLVWQGLSHQGHTQGAAQALLECHYSLHGAFLLEQPLLDHIDRVRHIPCIAVQGQMDFVCPPTTAVELGGAWPEMELRLVPGAGHSMYDPAISHELVNATDRMRALQPTAAAGAAAAAGGGNGRRRR